MATSGAFSRAFDGSPISSSIKKNGLQALHQKSANSKVPCQDLQVLDGKLAVWRTISHSSNIVERC